MANLKLHNIALTGLSAVVPSTKRINAENPFFSKEEAAKFTATTGVAELRVADKDTTTSDLGMIAAERLLDSMKIDRSEVDILVFVSQTPDYPNIPNTAPILQDRLGLSKTCLAFDLPLGCSGFVYGLSCISAYMQTGAFKKGLLICGDTPSKMVNPRDKSSAMLFGDAACAALLERTETAAPSYYNLGTDGSGYETIIVKDGGGRNPITAASLEEKQVEEGIVRRGCELILDGMDVFGFGITQAPKTVRELLQFAEIDVEEVDHAVFHQANLMMNEMIRKKLKLPKEKVPYSLELYGNTSSASIPLTMVTELKDQLSTGKNRLLFCGFGVGLSWGTCYLETNDLHVLELIEV